MGHLAGLSGRARVEILSRDHVDHASWSADGRCIHAADLTSSCSILAYFSTTAPGVARAWPTRFGDTQLFYNQ